MDDGNRVRIEVEVDRGLVERAEACGVDVGRALDAALRSELRRAAEAMNPAEREALRTRIREEIGAEVAWFDDHVEKHGLLSDLWRQFG